MKRSPRAHFLAASLTGLGAAAAARPTGAAEAYTLRLSLTSNINNEYFAIATQFARGVERRSNGQLKVAIYPSSSLAPQSQIIAALQSGVVDLTVQSNSLMS